ncbi:unnamed protein product, partial [Mesorhabditis belari]|uniref:Uncharacterized protein n=1 Tax=Mesorhabditis belari TaxID=2138241 RepID=A0AAF3J4J6_9BILA
MRTLLCLVVVVAVAYCMPFDVVNEHVKPGVKACGPPQCPYDDGVKVEVPKVKACGPPQCPNVEEVVVVPEVKACGPPQCPNVEEVKEEPKVKACGPPMCN